MHEMWRNRFCSFASWLWKSWANVIIECWLNWLDQNEINISFDFPIRPLRPIYVCFGNAVKVAKETLSFDFGINQHKHESATCASRKSTRFKETSFGRSLNHSSQKANRLQSQHEAVLIAIKKSLRLTFVSLTDSTQKQTLMNAKKYIIERDSELWH